MSAEAGARSSASTPRQVPKIPSISSAMDNRSARDSDNTGAPSNIDDNRSWMYKERKGKLFSESWKHGSGEDVYEELQNLVPDETGKHTFEGFGKEHNWIGVSGLWQLKYFKKLLLRHNIDVMHNEKNVAEALLNTCLDILDKTKDNTKARLDIALYCDRTKLHISKNSKGMWQKPTANYCVSKDDKMTIMKWFKEVKFPDGFAANLSKAVNLPQKRFIGLKSHDHHIIIERLLPVTLRGFIPEKEWKDIAELSYFYRQLCAKEINADRMAELEKEIPVLLCKLEKMFPPGFFNVMQHLILHLPYEAKVGGPVAYRWMYVFERISRLNHRPVSTARPNRSSSTASVGNSGSSQSSVQAKRARTPRTKTSAGDRMEEIDRPLIVPMGTQWEKHPYTARDPSTVQGALLRMMYPEPIGPEDDKKPVLCWEDFKWSPGPGVRTAASKIAEEFWWRFKCDPSKQEIADAVLEENFTKKVRQMLHEEKAATIKRLQKKGQLPAELTEVDEDGNHWPTKEALISAKHPKFGTTVGWCLLCEHWSSAEQRKKSLTNKRNRLANGKTIFHCSGGRNAVSTRQYLKIKLGKDPGISGVWHHTHNLNRGTDQEQICSQKAAERWENYDNAMKDAYGENWEEEHPELDGQIIYDLSRMPHGRLGIADELFTKSEKSRIKSKRVMATQPIPSAREYKLERENKRLQRENKQYRGIELVVRSLAEKGGLDFDALMQSVTSDMPTSDSEVGVGRERDVDGQVEAEPDLGSNTGGGNNGEADHDMNGNEYDMYGQENDEEYYQQGHEDYGHKDHDDYGHKDHEDFQPDYDDYYGPDDW